jgi:two-component system, sensor histidine kinase ChiS
LLQLINLILIIPLIIGVLYLVDWVKLKFIFSFICFIILIHITIFFYLDKSIFGVYVSKELYLLSLNVFLISFLGEVIYFKYKNSKDNKSESFEKLETKNYSHPELLKEDLVSNLSFELQAPLGSISGLAEYIRRDLGSDISDSTSENLEILKRTANKANLILENIIEYSYIVNNKTILKKEKISISNLINQVKYDFTDKTIKIKTEIIVNLQNEVDVYVDIVRVKQAFSNILTFLGKKIDKQSFLIESNGVPSRDDLIQINISDLSSDFEEEKYSNNFSNLINPKTPNKRLDSKTIGLSLSKKLIELHGGEIWNDPQNKYSNSISFTLPILTGHLILENKLKYEVQFLSEKTATLPFTILAVDDELINLEILKNIFNNYNYHLISLTNGYEAIELIENEIIPDVILIDIDMPEINGFELTSLVRKRYSMEEIPVILISSNTWNEDRSKVFECGANDIVIKPYNVEEMMIRINTLVTLRRSIIENQKHKMLEHELSLARKFQMKLLPIYKLSNKNVSIETLYIPMTYLAGDFYDYFEDSNGIGILIADVTGHGVPAAMVTSMLKAVFHTLRSDLSNPSKMMEGINQILIGNDNQLLTSVYLYIDTINKKLYSANAGHPPMLLQKKDGSLKEIKSKGKLIGFSIIETWETIEVNLDKGDRIILYTDGIVEVKNFNGEQLGEDKFINYIVTYKYLNAKDLIEATRRMVLDYCFQVNQEDDLTLIVIDILE